MVYSQFAEGAREESLEKESETLKIIREVVDLHFSLFRHRGRLDHTEGNKLQRVWLKLTTSAFHSSRIALHALETGYYTQSFMLTRAVYEDWLVAFDCEGHTETVEALLDPNLRDPRFEDMYQRLPAQSKSLWGKIEDYEGTYGFLSTFAHPRTRALEDTLNPDGTLRFVPAYNGIRFALAARFLLMGTLLMLTFVEKLADFLDTPESQDWKNNHLGEVKSNAHAALESLEDRLMSYRNQSG